MVFQWETVKTNLLVESCLAGSWLSLLLLASSLVFLILQSRSVDNKDDLSQHDSTDGGRRSVNNNNNVIKMWRKTGRDMFENVEKTF